MLIGKQYGLKNAHILLQNIQNAHSSQFVSNEHEQTFIEQQIIMQQQHNLQETNNKDNIFGVQGSISSKSSKKHHNSKENVTAQVQLPSFCDHLIVKHLQQINQVYEHDRVVLDDNWDNLIEEITLMVDRIKQIPRLTIENEQLKQENVAAQYKLQEVICEHHQNIKRYKLTKMQQHKFYTKITDKIKKLCLSQSQYLHPLIPYDVELVSYVQKYNNYLQEKEEFKKYVQNSATNHVNIDNEAIKQITGDRSKLNGQSKQQSAGQSQYLGRNKIIHEKQKAFLLGDLKNFAKKFKLPL